MYWNSSKKYQKKVDEWIKWPAYKKNLDTMKLLVRTPRFKKIVSDVRKMCKIPRFGYQSINYPNDRISGYFLFHDPYQEKPIMKLDIIVSEIIKEERLPKHFAKAIRSYIHYNHLSAPILDFVVTPGSTGSTVNFATPPQTNKFTFLDTNQKKLSSETEEIIANSPRLKQAYPALLIKRLDPKKRLDTKLKNLDRNTRKKLKLEKEYSKYAQEDKDYPHATDEDLATFLTSDHNHVQKEKKRIRNIRQQISNIYKERGLSED